MIVPTHPGAIGRLIVRVSWGMAIAGTLTICALALMLVVTIVARKTLGWQVTGDHELVRMFGAVAVSLMLPWCHVIGGNVVVDLLTTGLPRPVRDAMDRIGSLLLALVMALLAWRTALMAQGSLASGAFSPMLAWPLWMFQASLIPGLVVTAASALHTALAPGALAAREALSSMIGAGE